MEWVLLEQPGETAGKAPHPVVSSLCPVISVLTSSLPLVIFPPRISEILPLPGSPANMSVSHPLGQHFALILAVLTGYTQV